MIIHVNYWMKSKTKKIRILDDRIFEENDTGKIEILYEEIDIIIQYKIVKGSKFPWSDYQWFEVIDKTERHIKISCYVLSFDEFQEVIPYTNAEYKNRTQYLPTIK